MTKEEAFSDFYKSLSPQLHALNKLRRTPGIILTITRSFTVFGILLIWSAFFFFNGDNRIECIVAGIAVLVAAIVLSITSKKGRQKYFDFLRQHIFPPLIEFISPDLKYNHDEGILEGAFDISNMFDQEVQFINSSDLIEGYLNGQHVKASYIKAERVQSKSSISYQNLMFILPFPTIDQDIDISLGSKNGIKILPTEASSDHKPLIVQLGQLLTDIKDKIGLEPNITFRRSYMFLSARVSKNPFKIDPNLEITELSLFKIYDFLDMVFKTYVELTKDKAIFEV